MKKKHKVFVYGTLRPKGVEATHYIAGYQLYNYYDRFPYVQEMHDEVVHGNLVEVTDKQLNEFDRIEGIGHGLFKRQIVETYARDSVNNDCKAFVYVAGNVAPQPIQSGDWFDREG